MLFSAAQLKELRGSTGLSRERFARAIGTSIASVNRWELGASSPSGAVLAIYQTIHAAIVRRADVSQIAAEAEARGTPYFLYRLTEAAFGKEARRR
jgi:transcriptional regulator with XRE-family HTH domain